MVRMKLMLIAMVTVMVAGSHINGGSVAYKDIIGGGGVAVVEMMVTLTLTVVEASVLMWVMWC